MLPAYARADGYTRLGLARNPFAAEQHPGVLPALWLERAGPPAPHGPRQFLQLLGPRGAGKTSLLLHWRREHPGPYHYTPPGWGRWRWLPSGRTVYWDEIDRVPQPLLALALLLVAVRGGCVIAGSHADRMALARWCGFTCHSYTFPPLTAATLQEWANQRIQAAALPGHIPVLVLDTDTATEIVAQVGASLRDAAVLLHGWAARHAQAAAQWYDQCDIPTGTAQEGA